MIVNAAYCDPLPLPAGLFGPRERRVLPKMSRGWPAPGRIGLPVSGAERRMALAAGAQAESYGRTSLGREDAVKDAFQPFVPFVARRRFEPLRIEMIPPSSWAASLANLLAPADWKNLKARALRPAARLCEICGDGSSFPHCHELWEYRRPPDGGDWGVQRLAGLLCLCAECHEMFHPGLASVNGRSEEVAARTMAANAWTAEDYGRFAAWANRLCAARGRLSWTLDLSWLGPETRLVIGPGWRLAQDGVSLVADAARDYGGLTRTRIVGVAWSIGGVRRAEGAGAPAPGRSAQ